MSGSHRCSFSDPAWLPVGDLRRATSGLPHVLAQKLTPRPLTCAAPVAQAAASSVMDQLEWSCDGWMPHGVSTKAASAATEARLGGAASVLSRRPTASSAALRGKPPLR